jgi:hypothetical protein
MAPPTIVPAGTGKLTGKYQGVDQRLVNLMAAVARHYRRDIHISSGRREPKDQARAMWQNWTTNLRRGAIYTYLAGAGSHHREHLDRLHRAGDRAGFDAIVIQIAPRLSRHLTGEALDVAPKRCLTPAMLRTVGRYAKVINEATCYHVQLGGKWMPSVYSEELTKTW